MGRGAAGASISVQGPMSALSTKSPSATAVVARVERARTFGIDWYAAPISFVMPTSMMAPSISAGIAHTTIPGSTENKY